MCVTSKGNTEAQLQPSQHVNDPTLLEKTSNDHTAVPFTDVIKLEHRDVILGYFWKLKWLEHWGIYDKHDVDEMVIRANPFREWFDHWSEKRKGWLWNHPVKKVKWKDQDHRICMSNWPNSAVDRARKRIGEIGLT